MTVSTISFVDFVVSAARASARPTLLVRTSNEGATMRIDELFDMLPDEARLSLKREDVAIVEFEHQSELERTYERIVQATADSPSCLRFRADCVSETGQSNHVSTDGWID